MKRLLIVSPFQYLYMPFDRDLPHAGGSEQQVEYLIDYIRGKDKDTDVVIVCNRVEGLSHCLTCDGIRVYPTLFTRPAPLAIILNLLLLLRIVRQERITHVYVKTDPTPLMLSILVGRVFPSRVVFSFGIDIDKLGGRGWISRVHHRFFLLALRHASLIQCQTEDQAEDLRRHGLEGSVTRNVIPEDRAVDEDDGHYLLWVGNMMERTKRPHLLLEMAKAMPNEDFVMIGVIQDDQRDYTDRILREMETLDNVTYFDFVPPHEIMGYYSRAKALLNTSIIEGFPNTFLEAWLMGKPIVSFNVNPDGVLDDRRMGIISSDPVEISEYITTANNDIGVQYRRDYVLRNHNPETELGWLLDRIDDLT